MKKSLFAILFLSAVLAAGSYMLLNSRRMQLFGTLVARVETTQKRGALTFDDAPTPQTLRVLALLKQYRIPATFYAVGSQLERHPEIARSIVADGNELGNHSYSHQRFVFKTWDFTDNEISRTERLIRQAGYAGEITFRPPYGKKLLVLPWYLSRRNIRTVMWDVEPETVQPADAAAMADYALTHTQPGSIILLHPFCNDGCEPARAALPLIIEGLQAKGYHFVTVSELMAEAGH